MENITTEDTRRPIDENDGVPKTDSTEIFQKCILDLFEKNGVINDLRAYLRGHLVNVLKSAQAGGTPSCQKNFTQRLELPSQALNMLIVEYLLKTEFNYSLSVFISEIPLANMSFDFARDLLESAPDTNQSEMRFQDNDVWSILNYLDIKCNSIQAHNIVVMYNEYRKMPLLLCIFKCLSNTIQANTEDNENMMVVSSPERTTSNVNLSDISIELKVPNQPSQRSCAHRAFCKTCSSIEINIEDSYKKKKKKVNKQSERSSDTRIMDLFMKNINSVEKIVINELFEQLRTVYDAELEMSRQDKDKRVKKILEDQAAKIQEKYGELESSFKSREAALQAVLQRKKRFLWGVARALREQHKNMSHAMEQVRDEANKLVAKEKDLKSQLTIAENVLRERGEAMRLQIANELLVLEQHLTSMKTERDFINKERGELENLKQNVHAHTSKCPKSDKEDMKLHYDLLRNEIDLLKKYVSARLQSKCLIEQGTVTDSSVKLMNNEQEVERTEESPPNRLVNEFRKEKNVNFNQTSEPASASRSSLSSASGEARDAGPAARLAADNARLREFARQQRAHIESLEYQQARLQAQLSSRAPLQSTIQYGFNNSRTNSNTSAITCRNGAGEELNLFGAAGGSGVAGVPPRVLLPGDHVPFVGSERHADTRRYLMNQWRFLRHRIVTTGGVVKSRLVPPIKPHVYYNMKQRQDINFPYVEPSCSRNDTNQTERKVSDEKMKAPQSSPALTQRMSKTNSAVIAKESSFSNSKENLCSHPLERSPSEVLREAKLRLKKLEIEAEAVEKSYRNFKMRRDNKNQEKDSTDNISKKTTISNETYTKETDKDIGIKSPNISSLTVDIDQYLKDHQTQLDQAASYYKNKNTTSIKMQPIPVSYAIPKEIRNEDYLETPLAEFRKLYHSGKREEIIEERMSGENRHVRDEVRTNKGVIKYDGDDIRLKRDDIKIDKDEIRAKRESYQSKKKEIRFRENSSQEQRLDNVEIQNDTDKNRPNREEIQSNSSEIRSHREGIRRNDHVIKTVESTSSISSVTPKEERNTPSFSKSIKQKTNHTDSNENSHVSEQSSSTKHQPMSPKTKNDLGRNDYSKINLLKVDVNSENINTIPAQDLLIVVESSIETHSATSEVDAKDKSSRSIIVSPKNEKTVNIDVDLIKNDIINRMFDNEGRTLDVNEDYPDDFSAEDIEPSDCDNTPISLPKELNEDDFWDN